MDLQNSMPNGISHQLKEIKKKKKLRKSIKILRNREE